MKIILKDSLKLLILLSIWYCLLSYFNNNQNYKLYESNKYFPFHLVVTIGYYAILSVCYKILLIKDCDKEYTELTDEISQGRKYFEEKNIKYN